MSKYRDDCLCYARPIAAAILAKGVDVMIESFDRCESRADADAAAAGECSTIPLIASICRAG